MTAIGFVRGDRGPSGYFRIDLPCETMKAAGDDVFFALDIEDFEKAEVLVFQRQHDPRAIVEILRWKVRGKKIVVDFDDDFFNLDPHNTAVKVYGADVVQDLRRLISEADAVTVTTNALADVYGPHNDNIFVLPNSLPESAFASRNTAGDRTIIGWQGSASHHEDLKLLRSPLSTLARKHEFMTVLSGYNPPGLIKNAHMRPWVKFSPDLRYFDSFSDFTIGVCPLSKTRFNVAKSDLKWLEYSALAIPTVASASSPYERIRQGITGLLARNASDWEKHLAALLDDPDMRRSIGREAREYVRENRTIEKNVGLWREALEGLS